MDKDELGQTRHYYQIESVGEIRSANNLPPDLNKLTRGLMGYGEPFGDAATVSTLAGFITDTED